MRRGALYGALIAVFGSLAIAVPAVADVAAPTWNCRASVAALFGSTPQPRLEPLVANGDGTTGTDRPACADDREGLPSFDSPAGSPLTLHAQGPFSATSITPAIAAARDQAAYAGTFATNVAVGTSDGQVNVSATAVRAEAAASCVNGAPHLDGSSTVSDLRINGTPLPLDDSTVGQITSQINGSPLGGIVKVLVDQKIVTPTSVTIQAVRVELFDAAGSPQATLILGEAKVANQGDTCAPAQTATGGGSTGGGGGSTGGGTGGGTTGSGNSGNPPTTGSSGPPSTVPVIVNGRNGGCGHLKMWIEKVDLVHHLAGHPHSATARFGQRPLLRGRIVNCKGKPIVGARIDQIHHVGHGVGRIVKTGLRSRPGGKLTLILPLNLTTRTIVLQYRGNLASSKVTSRVVLHLRVVNKRGAVLSGRAPHSFHAANHRA